jgi:hypothetical protein
VLACVPEPLAEYRLQAGGLSADHERLCEGLCTVLERALAHPRLTSEDRSVAAHRLEAQRRELALVRLRRDIRNGAPEARRGAIAVARNPGFPAATRAKALASTVLPPAVASRLAASRESRARVDVRSDPGVMRDA